MNEIVIDLSQFPAALQEALRNQAIREMKPMKQLLAEIIRNTSATIVSVATESEKEEGQ